MADINDPILSAFVREVARPAAEWASQAEANSDFVYDRWNAEISPMLTGLADTDVIVENRTDIPALTVGDLKAVFASINRLRTANTTSQRRDITKARVRPLRAE